MAYAGTGRAPFGRGPSMAIMDRVRRGEHDLDGLARDLRRWSRAALDPDPSRRPRMGEVLHSLGAVPTTPRAPMDDVPPTQPHDLESLLWATQSVDEPATRAFEDPPTRRQEEPPTRGYDEDPTTYDDPPPNRQPYQTPPPADWAPPDQHQEPSDWIPADWEDQPPRASGAERFRRVLLGLTATAGVGVAAVVAPYVTAMVLAVLVVLLRGMSLTGARASDRRGLRGARWYDVVLTPLTAPWFLLASLPGTFLLLAWSAALAGSGALVLVALGIGLGWGCSRSGPSPRWCCGPARAPPGCGRRCAGSPTRWPGRGAAGRSAPPACWPCSSAARSCSTRRASTGRRTRARRTSPGAGSPRSSEEGATGPQACGMETRGPGIGLLRRAVWFSTASRCRALKTVS